MKKQWCVYILECQDGSFYTGVTNDVDARMKALNIIEMKYINDSYYLFYTTIVMGAESHENEKIAYMVSKDGETNWSASKILLSKGNPISFDNWGVMAPSVVFDGNDIYLFYTGWEVEDINCIEEPKTRWGIPLSDVSKCSYAVLGRAVCSDCIY